MTTTHQLSFADHQADDQLGGILAGTRTNANPLWLRAAVEAVARLAATRTGFISRDVWDALDGCPHETPHGQAMGGLLGGLQRAGQIELSGEWARDPVRRSMVPVWRKASATVE